MCVINRDRRPDRLGAFRAALSAAAGASLASRCQAVVPKIGRELSEMPDFARLSRGNSAAPHALTPGVALAHISVWRSLVEADEEQLQLVFEDHARPIDGFDRQLMAVARELGDAEFDLAFLGYRANDAETPATSDMTLLPMRWEGYLGGAFGYLVSSRGARKLVELVERGALPRGIDAFLSVHGPGLIVYESARPLIAPGGDELEPGAGATIARSSRRAEGIAIYAGAGWEQWHPIDIVARGLGGSETASYRLAEALSESGYVVTLYGDCRPGMMGDVLIRDWRSFEPSEPRRAVISVRLPELFDHEVAAERRLLWLHDVDVADRLTPMRLARIDNILCLSAWHRGHLARRYPAAEPKLARIRNGITNGYFTGEPAPQREPRVLFTSSPDRGLDLLLELWPSIRARVRDATLMCTYAPVYERVAAHDPILGAHREQIQRQAGQPGVQRLAGVSQPELAKLMRSSLVWAHPSCAPHTARFLETSCIGAMEAQAAGCCVVAAAWGALVETVRVGTLIGGDPRLTSFRERFADAVVAALTDARIARRAQNEGPAIAREWGWGGVAEMVGAVIESHPGATPYGQAER